MRLKEEMLKDPGHIARMLAAEQQIAEPVAVRFIQPLELIWRGIPTNVMKHIATGAGAAARRSSKGGKCGGGMGGQQAGGMKGVTNDIKVKPTMIKTDDVREAIEEALERRAERQARHIKVEVHDGAVKLSGCVRSWAEKRAILGIVSHAPGVHAVDENLYVDPMF
jgi:osmotically-inducible protein OsmY